MKQSRTRILVECALMIAMATVLKYIKVFSMPLGGSVTLCAMAPLVIASLRHGVKWGMFTGVVHGLIQMIMGFDNVLYCTTIPAMVGCVLLDYLLAYTAMGTSAFFAGLVKNRSGGVALGTAVAGLLRYFCSFLSGILIWGGYAPEGMPVWWYSLTYNGSYMLPEIAITAVAVVAIMKIVDKRMPVASVQG
ncbi:energy-coupled thiamine transporter ThiT [Ruminococcaceae bacterium OttesenSCG-928-L11]|nr:energy-coupled thiamine transporter ThiT [Ruminococcaceae bacterium OttesenSCG-928-L11]